MKTNIVEGDPVSIASPLTKQIFSRKINRRKEKDASRVDYVRFFFFFLRRHFLVAVVYPVAVAVVYQGRKVLVRPVGSERFGGPAKIGKKKLGEIENSSHDSNERTALMWRRRPIQFRMQHIITNATLL